MRSRAAPAPDDAGFEAALAFPVAPKAFTVVRFDLSDPSTDSAGDKGDFLVGGLDLPSVWNRGQAFWAISGVAAGRELAPRERSSWPTPGERCAGRVSDAFHHPVLGLPVSVERQVGGSWR